MKILFYPSFTEINERLILIHRADVQLSNLPENVRRGFDGVTPQQDEVNLSDLSSRWWLCPKAVKNLQERGYDRFKFAYGKA